MSSTCAGCNKTVYVKEKISILGKDWHKPCFKCTTCGMTLNFKNFESFEGKPYCRAHMIKPNAEGTTALASDVVKSGEPAQAVPEAAPAEEEYPQEE